MKLRTALMVLVGLVAILITYRLLIPHQPSVSDTLPTHLLGTFVSNDPRYSDRYVKMEADGIIFGTGGVTGKRYVVTGYNREYEDDGRVLNTVYFKGVDGSRMSRQFYYRSEDQDQLVFKNQPEVRWVRQPIPRRW